MKRCESCAAGHRKCTHQLGKRILVIPDTQVKPGVPIDHLEHIGRYIAHKRPDYIVMIGDWWDNPGLCIYDKGKLKFEGRRVLKDIEFGNQAMDLMTSQYRNIPGYTPEEHFCLGNHEERLERLAQERPELEGVIGYHMLNLKGWTVHPYLKVVKLEGVKFAHYFTSGTMGRPAGSAAVMLKQAMGSAVQGHVQKVDMAIHEKTGHIAMMVGTCYQHDEEYLGYQGNDCRRQVVMMNQVKDGVYDPMFVSLDFLRAKYSAPRAA